MKILKVGDGEDHSARDFECEVKGQKVSIIIDKIEKGLLDYPAAEVLTFGEIDRKFIDLVRTQLMFDIKLEYFYLENEYV